MLFLDSMGISETVLGISQVGILKAVFEAVKEQGLPSVDDNTLLSILQNDIDKEKMVEVYPDMHFIEQRLFIISCN